MIVEFLNDTSTLLNHTKTPRLGRYNSLMDFLSQHGRKFDPAPLPGDVKPGRKQECFRTCGKLALDFSRFTYCEGYAAGIIPVLHAWLVDEHGNLIDPTWTGTGGRPGPGFEYFGVAIKTSYLVKHLLATKIHSPVLDDWQHRWPILTAEEKEWKI